MKRSNALIGQEVVEHFKKCKMTTQDFIINSAKEISSYSEFETFMLFLKEKFQIKVERTPNDECVTISLNGELFCSLIKIVNRDKLIMYNGYQYDNYDEDFNNFLGDVFGELNWDYLNHIKIPIYSHYALNVYSNLLLKAYYLEQTRDNIPLN